MNISFDDFRLWLLCFTIINSIIICRKLLNPCALLIFLSSVLSEFQAISIVCNMHRTQTDKTNYLWGVPQELFFFTLDQIMLFFFQKLTGLRRKSNGQALIIGGGAFQYMFKGYMEGATTLWCTPMMNSESKTALLMVKKR